MLNTHRPLFRDVRLRQAVNYAIDRRKLAEIAGDMQPTDQYLPPGMPGFKDVDIYPFTPNVSAAKRLAGTQRRTAILYTEPGPVFAQFAQVDKAEPARDRDRRRRKNPHGLRQPAREAWRAVRSRRPDRLCAVSIPQTSSACQEQECCGALPFFDDPSYKRKVTAASRLSGPRRYRAYGALDVDTARNRSARGRLRQRAQPRLLLGPDGLPGL